MQKEKVIIIGSGPAGLTSALYTARANLDPLVISGNQLGGQISITSEVENYPGFPEGTTGPELVDMMQKQAERFGARLLIDEVTEVNFRDGPPFYLKTHGDEFEAEAIIITVGASPKRLEIPGEEELIGRGVSFCATCDGFFFREKDVLVVGGGDSAGEALKRRATSHDKIEFVWDTVLEKIEGNGKVESVVTRNVKTEATEELETDGVFIFIGHYPNSSLFEDLLEMDERKYLITDDNMMTSIPGIFAAGEIQDPVWRQIATSVGQGCVAAMACERWLEAQK
jgi:thioredoxin reductase (NADPH)